MNAVAKGSKIQLADGRLLALGRVRMEGAMARLHEVEGDEQVPMLAKVALSGTPHDALNHHSIRVETEVLSACNHPGIVTYRGHADDDRVLFLDWLPGPDLRMGYNDLPLPTEDAVVMLREMLDALSHLHGKGWVHGDLKPENIVLDASARPVLVDLASAVPPPGGERLGSPPYCPPEQLDKGAVATPAGDVYSAARVLEFLMLGETPATQLNATWLDELPMWVASWVVEATHPDPARRFQDAGEALRRLPPPIRRRPGTSWFLELEEGRRIALPARIGRDPENDIRVDAPDVSRFHVTLNLAANNRPFIQDHGRTPQVTVDDHPVGAWMRVRPGETIAVCGHIIGRMVQQ